MALAYKVAGNSPRGNRVQRVTIDELPRNNPWKPYRLKFFPRRINGIWYVPGNIVYRRRINTGYASVGEWPRYAYGDEFDVLKWQ